MSRPMLKLADLAAALKRFGAKYQAIDVFADDVRELDGLRAGQPLPGIEPLPGPSRFLVKSQADSYELEIFQDRGVVRLSKVQLPEGTASIIAATTGLSAAAGAAIGAAMSKKGDAWPTGLLLGMLVGASLGGAPRRVFTLQFDENRRNWVAYDGGLVRWMKSALAAGAIS